MPRAGLTLDVEVKTEADMEALIDLDMQYGLAVSEEEVECPFCHNVLRAGIVMMIAADGIPSIGSVASLAQT